MARVALLGAVALAALGLVLATRTSFFYADDYLNFALAHQFGLSASFLKLAVIGGELAPGHRLLDWLMGAHIGLHWPVAIVIMMLFWLGAVVAFKWTAEELFESRWTVLIGTVFFASSPAFVRAIQWWANAEHVVPALCGTLVTIAASLHWMRTRRSSALLIAAVGYGGALMFYPKAILVPLYVVLLAYLVPSRLAQAGPLRQRLRDDVPLLAVLVGITVLYVIAVRAGGYLEVPKQSASLSRWLAYLRVSWLQGAALFLIGQSAAWNSVGVGPPVEVLAQVVLLALLIFSIARNRSAWRSWAFYAIAWLANVLIVGRARLGPFGPGIGFDPRYNAEMAFLLPLALGSAFYGTPAETRPVSGRIALVGAAVATAFAVSLAISYERISSAWPAGGARSWVSHVRSSVAALRRGGIEPSVIDGVVPLSVEPGGMEPYDLLSRVLPELRDRIVVDDQSGRDPPALTAQDGTVRIAPARELASIPHGAFCQSAQRVTVQIPFRLRRPLVARAGVLEIRLSPPQPHGSLSVYFDDGGGYQTSPSKTLSFHPGNRVLRAELTGTKLVRLRLDLLPDSAICTRRMAVVEFRA